MAGRRAANLHLRFPRGRGLPVAGCIGIDRWSRVDRSLLAITPEGVPILAAW
ncbi:MAG: hypothetical protein GYA24_04945 [Candidatus Lokiarchaeota archaeon]|nr:hypothetical protein [Candidatus Lokiarchaeota archaeon]